MDLPCPVSILYPSLSLSRQQTFEGEGIQHPVMGRVLTRLLSEVVNMTSGFRKEMDSLGEVNVPADKLWGAQTQRSLEHFSIGKDLIPRGMTPAYRILKKE